LLQTFVINLFLFFPKDKTAYIPAFISLSIFTLLAILVFLWIIKVNKKQEEKAVALERKIKNKHY
jgi:nitrate/nitrite transporter NarK